MDLPSPSAYAGTLIGGLGGALAVIGLALFLAWRRRRDKSDTGHPLKRVGRLTTKPALSKRERKVRAATKRSR